MILVTLYISFTSNTVDYVLVNSWIAVDLPNY